jgi:hypothetical protein
LGLCAATGLKQLENTLFASAREIGPHRLQGTRRAEATGRGLVQTDGGLYPRAGCGADLVDTLP